MAKVVKTIKIKCEIKSLEIDPLPYKPFHPMLSPAAFVWIELEDRDDFFIKRPDARGAGTEFTEIGFLALQSHLGKMQQKLNPNSK